MKITNAAWRTDQLFARWDGAVEDCGDHVVVRTPANPFYFWGNYVLFADAPGDLAEVQRRREVFARAFPGGGHEAIGWESPDDAWGAATSFAEATPGWRLEDGVVHACDAPGEAPAPSLPLDVRPLASDADWAASDALNALSSAEGGSGPRWDAFLRGLRVRYRAMAAAGLGTWLGAFHDGRLVAHLGLFRDRELARFQSVETHPGLRGRGACAALVVAAQRLALQQWRCERVILVAQPGSQAERIYRRAGFAPLGMQRGIYRGPEDVGG